MCRHSLGSFEFVMFRQRQACDRSRISTCIFPFILLRWRRHSVVWVSLSPDSVFNFKAIKKKKEKQGKNMPDCFLFPVNVLPRSIPEQISGSKGQHTHTQISNIPPFGKYLTPEPDTHKNRQLQITAPSMSYLCQLLTINGCGAAEARCINPEGLTLSQLLHSIDSTSAASMIQFWWPSDRKS